MIPVLVLMVVGILLLLEQFRYINNAQLNMISASLFLIAVGSEVCKRSAYFIALKCCDYVLWRQKNKPAIGHARHATEHDRWRSRGYRRSEPAQATRDTLFGKSPGIIRLIQHHGDVEIDEPRYPSHQPEVAK